MFFFAVNGLVAFTTLLNHNRRLAVVLMAAGLVVVGWIPWQQAAADFRAHLGLGRALEWVDENRADRHVDWLQIAWFGDPVSVTTLEQLELAAPGTWLISYFPWDLVNNHPSLLPYFEDTSPVAVWPSLYSTDTMWTELHSRGNNDFRYDPILRDVRVFDVSSLLERMKGQPLEVESVSADSVDNPRAEPVNVFDRDESPDGVTSWISANTPMPHYLEVKLAKPTAIGEMRIVLSPTDRSTSRISELEVQLMDERGGYRTVWRGEGLEKFPVIAPRWEAAPTAAIKLIIRHQRVPVAETKQARIEEIEFPGYQVVAPKPQRAFAELSLQEVRPVDGRHLLLSGKNLTRYDALVLGGVRLSTVLTQKTDEMMAILPEGYAPPTDGVEAYLSDNFRQSNTLIIRPLR